MSESAPSQAAPERVERLIENLDRALGGLADAKPFARAPHQNEVFQAAEALMATDEGMRRVYGLADRFDAAGVFTAGPWEDPAKLQPTLVAGSLEAAGVYPVIEILSELRMLAIAKGRVPEPLVPPGDAAEFLEKTLALNLRYLFGSGTEEDRVSRGPHGDTAERLFRLLADELTLAGVRADVVSEIEQISIQRPIMTRRVVELVELARRIPPAAGDEGGVQERLDLFHRAISGPSPMSVEHPELADYRAVLIDLAATPLSAEADAFASSLHATGLACPHHAVLLRTLKRREPALIGPALGLNPLGLAELDQNRELAHQLIQVAILPATAQSIYGFARLLERGLLSRAPVAAGLRRLVELDLTSEVRRNLLARRKPRDGVTANSVLVAGALSVLGQPLGIGQGNNPTCQAARGISLFSQHAPARLLDLVATAARDGLIEVPFDGAQINSQTLTGGLAPNLDLDLDPISVALVPQLDRVYDEIMRRVALRPEDGHKWANPALYGRFVPTGFESALDLTHTRVVDYEAFVRRFFATHHPAYNDGHELVYPNPVGICVTNAHGDHLGAHAVALQRIAEDPHGTLRAYFFNPNNEGRQNWGLGVRPSIRDHGEEEGESSLPFHQFVSRLYAFHYNPYEEGDAFAVPDGVVAEIESLAHESWGRAFIWGEGTP